MCGGVLNVPRIRHPRVNQHTDTYARMSVSPTYANKYDELYYYLRSYGYGLYYAEVLSFFFLQQNFTTIIRSKLICI